MTRVDFLFLSQTCYTHFYCPLTTTDNVGQMLCKVLITEPNNRLNWYESYRNWEKQERKAFHTSIIFKLLQLR